METIRKQTGERHENGDNDRQRFSALPVLAGGSVGFVIGGPLGAAAGAFIGDVLTGAQASQRIAMETQVLKSGIADSASNWRSRASKARASKKSGIKEQRGEEQ